MCRMGVRLRARGYEFDRQSAQSGVKVGYQRQTKNRP